MSLVVTIFSAVHLEAKAIAKAIAAPVPIPTLPVHSTFENLKVIHHLIGMRAVGLPNLTVDPDTRYILLAGVAGALDPHFRVGDLILCDCPEVLAPRLEIPRGLIHTAPDVICTMTHKAELFAKTGAGAVDMESALVRDFAAKGPTPFLSLRAISDSARQSLSPQLVHTVNQWGRVRKAELASFVIANPFRIFGLIGLGRDTSYACRRLGQGVVTILRAIGGQ